MESPLCVLAPSVPGDLAASRALLAVLGRCTEAHVLVHERLLPLIVDLGAVPDGLGRPGRISFGAFTAAPQGLERDRTLLDLVGLPDTLRWLHESGHPSLGHRIDEGETLPYRRCASWRLPAAAGGEDQTHFGVRLLRIVPGFEDLRTWPAGAFEAALYPRRARAEGRLALAPGCGRGAKDKRMPVDVWRSIAHRARTLGLRPVWFIGPDEFDLWPSLARPGDELVSGAWDEVLDAHAGCSLGVTNDTCHMHLRAHLARPTLAFFRRAEVDPWGAYPFGVTCVPPPTSLDSERSVALAEAWIDAGLRR